MCALYATHRKAQSKIEQKARLKKQWISTYALEKKKKKKKKKKSITSL